MAEYINKDELVHFLKHMAEANDKNAEKFKNDDYMEHAFRCYSYVYRDVINALETIDTIKNGPDVGAP